jgi:hypothetical protein
VLLAGVVDQDVQLAKRLQGVFHHLHASTAGTAPPLQAACWLLHDACTSGMLLQ